MTPTPHGGRLIEARRRFPDAPLPWLDLSTGINPHPYPFVPPGPEAWRRLPEPEQIEALEAAAANAYGVTDPAMVVAAPGTQALIQLLPRLLPRQLVAIPGLTYAEHAAAWRSGGAEILRNESAAALVLCNPNNPDGARREPAMLREQARTLDLLVLDEAFADFEPGLSLAPGLPLPGVVILRSFGKAYGVAGLRLGFALAEPGVAAAIRAALGPWAVSGPAMAIGRAALADATWRREAAERAHRDAARLRRLLEAAGFNSVGGTALFHTVSSPVAAATAERLAHAGILVRRFAAAPTWLRFGLPPDEAAWTRLAGALELPA